MKHRSDIDGLRTVAVIPVVLFHTDLGIFPGGFVGVDVFFVISGFLITGIIARELDQGTFSIADFYARRVRRIFPALFAVLLASTLAALAIMIPQDLSEFGQSQIAAATFGANIFFWLNIDYFSSHADFKPLLHTWSLAVEEQYYVFFPLGLWVLYRWRWLLTPTLMLIAAVSLALSIYGVRHNIDPTFYLTPFRAWELLLGALLALGVIAHPKGVRVSNAAVLLGLFAIFVAAISYNDRMLFPGEAALLPCLGAAAVIWGGSSFQTWGGRALSWSPVVFVGQISYSLYLWHWPILSFYRLSNPEPASTWQTVLLLAFIFLVAVLSWRFIEQPFRTRRLSQVGSRGFILGGAASIAMAVMVSVPLISCGCLSGRFNQTQLHMLQAVDESIHWNNELLNERTLRFTPAAEAPVLPAGGDSSVLIWGDSHATAILPALLKAQDDVLSGRAIRVLAMRSCRPLLGEAVVEKNEACLAFNDAVASYLATASENVVIIAGRWMDMPSPEGESIAFEKYVSALENAVLASKVRGREVYLVGPVPEIGFDVPRYLVSKISTPLVTRDLSHETQRYEEIEGVLSDVATSTGAILLLPRVDLCDSANRCPIYRDGAAMYFDSHHLTVAAAGSISRLFSRELSHLGH